MGRKKKYKSTVYQSLAVITQFGINMLVPIFLCSFVGLFIDKKLGTGFWFVLLFFVGALAGFRNIYILAKKIYEGDKDENKRDL
jgi:F0F1-type ATP synthase assembly protein I